MSSFLSEPNPKIMAHRGFSLKYPENTMMAFKAAAEICPYIEFDVHLSRDKIPIVFHDRNTLRVCGEDFEIESLNLDDILQLDAGYTFTLNNGETHPYRGKKTKIPTLEEVLSAFPQLNFVIEIKMTDKDIENPVIDVIKRTKRINKCIIATEDSNIIKRIRRTVTEVPTGFTTTEIKEFLVWIESGRNVEYHPPGHALFIPPKYGTINLADKGLIEIAHDNNLEVYYWTINDKKEIDQLMRSGADGIITDDPISAVQVKNQQ